MATGDHEAAALVYSAQNRNDWAKSLLLPGLQALANIKVIDRQKKQYDNITADQRQLLDDAIDWYFDRIDDVLPTLNAAYPDVPRAAEYVPVDPCKVVRDNIECNLGRITSANGLVQTINRMHQQAAFTRAVVLDPRWWVNVELYAVSLNSLLKGEIDQGDLMDLTTGTAEMALATGRVGATRLSGQRRLGIERLRRQHEGRSELRRQVEMSARIFPSAKSASVEDFMVKPEQRIALALTQAQLIQNSLQNVYNQQAQKQPYRLAAVNLRLEKIINRLQMRVSRANLQNTFVPNYASIFQPQITALTESVANLFDTPRTNMSSYDSPSQGGNWLAQQGANPFTSPKYGIGVNPSK